MMERIFDNGLKVDIATLRKGARTTDSHIFINNDLFTFLTEIQINYEDVFDNKLLRSRLVNIAIMRLCNELINLPDADALNYIDQLNQEYKEKY